MYHATKQRRKYGFRIIGRLTEKQAVNVRFPTQCSLIRTTICQRITVSKKCKYLSSAFGNKNDLYDCKKPVLLQITQHRKASKPF